MAGIIAEAELDDEHYNEHDYRDYHKVRDVRHKPYEEIHGAYFDGIEAVGEAGLNTRPRALFLRRGHAEHLAYGNGDGAVIHEVIIGAKLAFVAFKLIAHVGQTGFEGD